MLAPIALVILLIGGAQTAIIAADGSSNTADRAPVTQVVPPKPQAANPFLG